MTRRNFEQSLQNLQDSVLTLGAMAGHALVQSVGCLEERDLDASRAVIHEDRIIDEKRYAIEAEALTLIATQAPIAGDMRMLAAVLFISNELERIADYGKGIARLNIRIGDEPLMKPLDDIPRMATLANKMLRRSLDAFAERDAGLARAVIPEDDAVDALYDRVNADLMTMIVQDPSRLRQANLLNMVAHNLERAADRATNVCERVIYVATGELLDSGWEQDGT